MGGGFAFTGGHTNGAPTNGKRKSRADSPHSHEFTKFAESLYQKWGHKLEIVTGDAAVKRLAKIARSAGDGRIINAAFEVLNDNKARIVMGPNSTLYDFWHESLHMEQLMKLPESGRAAAWGDMIRQSEHLLEVDVVKQMRDKPEAWKAMSPMLQAHALVYAKDVCEQMRKDVPQELERWIQEWQQNNKASDINRMHDDYLGIMY